MPLASQPTETWLDGSATDLSGTAAVGRATKAAKSWMPDVAAYETEHWLPWPHAPTTLPTVRSKISIARSVPVTVAFAVAVRTAGLPLPSVSALEASDTRSTLWPPSEATGTLGVTRGADGSAAEVPAGAIGASAASLQAATGAGSGF